MKNLSLFTVAAFLLLLFAGCQKDQMAPLGDVDPYDITSPRESAVIPFHANFTAFPEIVCIDKEGTLRMELMGKGDATFMGMSRCFSVSKIYNTNQKPPWPQAGTIVFVSERGDSLVGMFNGMTEPRKYSPYVSSGNFRMVRGTGPFKGYTVNGTYDYVVARDASSVDVHFKGVLVKPKHYVPLYPEQPTF